MCCRLWSEGEQLEAQNAPEILQADLAPLALELAQWGKINAARLPWLDPPPAAALAQAVELLQQLSAVDASGRITGHGRQLLTLPLHPRLAHMVVQSSAWNAGWLACLLAVLVSERDMLSPGAGRGADVMLRVRWLMQVGRPDSGVDRKRLQRVMAVARDIARQAGISTSPRVSAEQAGLLLGLAYPDRIARRRAGAGARYLISNGRGAYLSADDPLGASEWLAVAELDGTPREARIFLAANLNEHEVREAFTDQPTLVDRVEWDDEAQAVRAVREERLGAIVLDARPLVEADPQRVTELLLAAIRRHGPTCLPWTRSLRNWPTRPQFCADVCRCCCICFRPQAGRCR